MSALCLCCLYPCQSQPIWSLQVGQLLNYLLACAAGAHGLLCLTVSTGSLSQAELTLLWVHCPRWPGTNSYGDPVEKRTVVTPDRRYDPELVPPEWSQWLKTTRREPPTEEEVAGYRFLSLPNSVTIAENCVHLG